MPKQKTCSGAKKRFRVRGNGSIKRRRSYRNHILTKKANKRMRRLRTPGAEVGASDAKQVNRLLKNQ